MIRRRLTAILMAAVMMFFTLMGTGRARAASSAEIREQIIALEEQEATLDSQLQVLEAQLSDTIANMQATVKNKNTIDQQIVLLYDRIKNINAQIAAYALLVADQQDKLDQAQARLDELNGKYKERIRAMEESAPISYWTVLFRADSFAEFLDRLNMIWEIADADQRRMQQIREAALTVAAAKTALEQEKANLEQTRMELCKLEEELKAKRIQTDSLLQDLVAQGEQYEQLLEEGEERQDALMQQIAQMENAFDEAVYEEWLATYVPPEKQPDEQTPSDEVPSDDSDWITPVPYYTLTSPFGMRLHPILGIYRMHNGVDLACAEGTCIYASRGGQVEITGYQEDGAGNYVQINHGDGYRSIYMHMTHYIVSQGEYVAAGQVIGYVGSTGLSKGNHLHFGISYNGEYVNPMEYIG